VFGCRGGQFTDERPESSKCATALAVLFSPLILALGIALFALWCDARARLLRIVPSAAALPRPRACAFDLLIDSSGCLSFLFGFPCAMHPHTLTFQPLCCIKWNRFRCICSESTRGMGFQGFFMKTLKVEVGLGCRV